MEEEEWRERDGEGGGHGDLPLTGYKDVFKTAGPLVITTTRQSKALQSRARTMF